VEQLKCLYGGSTDPETLAKLFTKAAGGIVGAPPPQELVDIFTGCGFPFPGPGEEGGPPELTQEQQSCIIEAIGDTAFDELYAGQRRPTPEEIQKIEVCEPTGPGEEGGPPDLTTEQQGCIIEAIGDTAFSELMSGQMEPTPEELQKIGSCMAP